MLTIMGAILSSSSPVDPSSRQENVTDQASLNLLHSSTACDGESTGSRYSNFQRSSICSIQENGLSSNSLYLNGRKESMTENLKTSMTGGQRKNMLRNLSRQHKTGNQDRSKNSDKEACIPKSFQTTTINRNIPDDEVERNNPQRKSSHKSNASHRTLKQFRDDSDRKPICTPTPILFRNDTPYCRARYGINRNLSASLYEPSPPDQTVNHVSKPHMINNLAIPEKHVHFNQRKHMSIPNSDLSKRNSYCAGDLQQRSEHAPQVNSPPLVCSNRRSMDQFDASPLLTRMNECVCAYQWNSDIFNPFTVNSSSHCFTTEGNSYQCCPYHLEFDQYAYIRPANPHHSSPHPFHDARIYPQTSTPIQKALSVHRNSMQSKKKPNVSTDFNLSRDSRDVYNHGENRNFLPQLDSNESSNDVFGPRCRKLTKSVSCYALKFFAHYQNQFHQPHHFGPETQSRSHRHPCSETEKLKSSNSGMGGKRLKHLRRSQSHKVTTDGCEQQSDDPNQIDKSCSDKNLSLIWKEKRGNRRKLIMVPVNTDSRVPQTRSTFDRTVSSEKRLVYSYNNSDVSSAMAKLHMNTDNSQQSPHTCLADTKHTICKATTSELLRCISFYIVAKLRTNTMYSTSKKMNNLCTLQPAIVIGWIKSVDRALIVQGWSDLAFINPAHLVFLFMMLKDCLDGDISSERELHTIVMACLYISYSYMGNEISYPLKPFLVAETNQLLIQHNHTNRALLEGENALLNGHGNAIRNKVIDQVRNRFWQYCLRIINAKSTDMLQINAYPARFTELFSELKSYENVVLPLNCAVRLASTPD